MLGGEKLTAANIVANWAFSEEGANKLDPLLIVPDTPM